MDGRPVMQGGGGRRGAIEPHERRSHRCVARARGPSSRRRYSATTSAAVWATTARASQTSSVGTSVHARTHGEFGRADCDGFVGDVRHAGGTHGERSEHPAGVPCLDGPCAPFRDGLVDRDHEQEHWATQPVAQRGEVCGPGPGLVGVAPELDLDHDRDGRRTAEAHDEVGAKLRGVHRAERDVLDVRLAEFRQLPTERVAHELGCERGSVAEQNEKRFVQERRGHATAASTMRPGRGRKEGEPCWRTGRDAGAGPLGRGRGRGVLER